MKKVLDLDLHQSLQKKDTIKEKEILKKFTMSLLPIKKEQSSRCSQCGVPFCQIHCPLSNNIPDWLKLTAEGRLKKLMKYHRARTICQKFVEEFSSRQTL